MSVTMTELTPENVDQTFRECLFLPGEDSTVFVFGNGVVIHAGFHPGRLEKQRETIADLLAQLPDQFKVRGGGGWSFLNACMNRDGEEWTGSQRTMDQLFTLGLAAGLVEELLPREVWPQLPGGVPYYAVKG